MPQHFECYRLQLRLRGTPHLFPSQVVIRVIPNLSDSLESSSSARSHLFQPPKLPNSISRIILPIYYGLIKTSSCAQTTSKDRQQRYCKTYPGGLPEVRARKW